MTPAFVVLLSHVTLVWGYWSANFRGFTAIPVGIPDGETSVSLYFNEIASVDSYLLPQNLIFLDISRNQLSSFPNLTNVAATLKILRLSYNDIEVIDPPLLNELTNLEELDLRYNRLTDNSIASVDSFLLPPNLKNLDIYSNQLRSFPNLKNKNATLKILRLSSNRIEVVDPSLLNALTNLKELDLRSNRLTDNSIASVDSFLFPPNLKNVDISWNQLSSFPNLTNVAVTLKILHLSRNDIEVVDPSLLNALTNLEELDLSYNRLTDNSIASVDSFLFPPNLKNLSLYSNQLSSFPNLTNVAATLKILHLSRNDIEVIDPSLLNALINLEEFDLRYNSLNDSSIASVISSLLPPNSTNFDISSNRLSSFPNLTNAAATLKFLRLSYNEIEVIDPPLLNALTNLEQLHLRYNRLTFFPDVPGPGSSLDHLDLYANMLPTFPSLKQIGESLISLYLSRNSIEQPDFRMKLFAGQLTHLHLRYSKIGKVPLLHHAVKSNITYLDVSYCSITSIIEQEMRGFNSLEIIKLEGNSFTNFPDLSAAATTLISLSLYNNELPMRAAAKILQKFTKKTTTYLSGTQWKMLPILCHLMFTSAPVIHLSGDLNCDCHAVWLKLLDARPSKMIMTQNLLCSKPEEHQNKDWRSIPVIQLKCEDMYREALSTAIDIENYYCDSAPVVERSRVRNAAICHMKCMHEASCIYYNIEDIKGSNEVICSLTDISKSDLSQPSNFTATGYSRRRSRFSLRAAVRQR